LCEVSSGDGGAFAVLAPIFGERRLRETAELADAGEALPISPVHSPVWRAPAEECTLAHHSTMESHLWGVYSPMGIPIGECTRSPMGSHHCGLHIPKWARVIGHSGKHVKPEMKMR
jgi:hypothetical protein